MKAILQKKDPNPCQTRSDMIYIYEFDNAITFKLKSISLFWCLDNFLEKDKSGLLFQINMFTGLSTEEVCTFLIFEPFIYTVSKC